MGEDRLRRRTTTREEVWGEGEREGGRRTERESPVFEAEPEEQISEAASTPCGREHPKRGRASPSLTERLAAVPRSTARRKSRGEEREGGVDACVRGGVGGRWVGVCRWVGADPFAVTCLKGEEEKKGIREMFFSATELAWKTAVRGERCYWCCPWC